MYVYIYNVNIYYIYVYIYMYIFIYVYRYIMYYGIIEYFVQRWEFPISIFGGLDLQLDGFINHEKNSVGSHCT